VYHDTVRLASRAPEISGALDTLADRRDQLLLRQRELESLPSVPPSANGAEAADRQAATTIAAVAAVVAAVDAYLERLVSIPDGATRSPLTAAVLRSALHDGSVDSVLLVKAESASGMRLLDDRPLWFADRFSIVSAATLTWALIEIPGGQLRLSGVTTGTALTSGKVGRRVSFD
jgi:hypothetical protein